MHKSDETPKSLQCPLPIYFKNDATEIADEKQTHLQKGLILTKNSNLYKHSYLYNLYYLLHPQTVHFFSSMTTSPPLFLNIILYL